MKKEEILIRYAEDTLDDVSELKKLLATDKVFSDQFVEYMVDSGTVVEHCLQQDVHCEGCGDLDDPGPKVIQIQRGTTRIAASNMAKLSGKRRRSTMSYTLAWVATFLALVAAGIYYAQVKQHPRVARVIACTGPVNVKSSFGTHQVASGDWLRSGDVIDVRQPSAMAFSYKDEYTAIEVAPDSLLTLEGDAGKDIRMRYGRLHAKVQKQVEGESLEVFTPQAQATVVGTSFTLQCNSEESRLDVHSGMVRFLKLCSGELVEVGMSHYAVAAEGAYLHSYSIDTEWEYAAGINFNGPSVVVDGFVLEGSDSVASLGLSIGPEGGYLGADFAAKPIGVKSASGLEQMLMTGIGGVDGELQFSWEVPQPGRYQLFFWIMEAEGYRPRSMTMRIEERVIRDGLAYSVEAGEWARYGPYELEIKDGAMDISLTSTQQQPGLQPQLMGMLVLQSATSIKD